MNLPDEKREAVRRLLDEHQPLPITETGLVHIGYGCPAPCCWGNEGGYDLDAHRRHVADALAPVVARWLAEARAEAWDEGYRSGHSNAMRRMSDEPNAPTTPNPYRADVLAAGDGDEEGL